MARIKCQYSIPICTLDGSNFLERCESDICCDYRPSSCKEFFPHCEYSESRSGEFERVARFYEYKDGILELKNKIYFKNEIKYLEIDGRILVNREE